MVTWPSRSSQNERRVAPARPIIYHKRICRFAAAALLVLALAVPFFSDSFGVRELQIHARLLEVANDGFVHAGLPEDGLESAQGLDRKTRLREIACFCGDPAEAEGRRRGERVHEDVCDGDAVERLAQLVLVREIRLVRRRLVSH
jgi:hypothetical protein